MQVIDKALLDAVVCGEAGAQRGAQLVREMHRVLKPGGVYVVISHANEAARQPYFDAIGWTPTVVRIQVPPAVQARRRRRESYFAYVCVKPDL